MTTALVFAGGELGDVVALDLPGADLVIAADSGLHHAISLDIEVDVVVGDMDSVDPDLLVGRAIERHPVKKDATDLELALDCAVRRGATRVTVVGGIGGRFDHLLGNIFALCRADLAHVNLSAIMGRSRVYVVRDQLELNGRPGEIISQFAMNGPVTGLTIEGLEWSGVYETVEFGSSLCMSDKFVGPRCRFQIERGTLLVVHELGLRAIS